MASVYFAHPWNTFGTQLETELVAVIRANLRTLGDTRFVRSAVSLAARPDDGRPVDIVNPADAEHQVGYDRAGMDYFREEVLPRCDACAFLAFRDGAITSGVVMEVEHFIARGWPVWEVKLNGLLWRMQWLAQDRCLTHAQSRARVYVDPTVPRHLRLLTAY